VTQTSLPFEVLLTSEFLWLQQCTQHTDYKHFNFRIISQTDNGLCSLQATPVCGANSNTTHRKQKVLCLN